MDEYAEEKFLEQLDTWREVELWSHREIMEYLLETGATQEELKLAEEFVGEGERDQQKDTACN